MNRPSLAFLIILSLSCFRLHSQSLSVNLNELNEYYRKQQLLGNLDSNISFLIKPLFSNALSVNDIYDPENNLDSIRKTTFKGRLKFFNGNGTFQLLPITLLNQFNSHHQEGFNDGSMVPAKGTQLRASAGFYFKLGPLNIKLKPEFVYAQNKAFMGFPAEYVTRYGYKFPKNPYLSNIDLPEKFGVGAFKKAYWGQSSISLNLFSSVSLGLSNENLWWGPGYKNSLLMTNSAPGFWHLSFNTIKPLKTPIGSFEWQVISGRLEESGYTYGLTKDWRYINAIVLNYQPKWIPGLFLGFARSFQVYHKDIGNSFGDYFPIFSFLTKERLGANNIVDDKNKNQLISIFMRWVFKESNAEIYFEYGREDHSADTRDFLIESSHSAAYILGFRKLYIINKSESSFIQLLIETTKLSSDQTTINRKGGMANGSWYQHSRIQYGYTHRGQLLGAGIGPGSNLQTFHLSWNRGLKQIGIELERFVHNNDFWYNFIKDPRTNWIDLSATLNANWDYKHFILFGKMKFISSINYQWLYEPKEIIPGEYWMPTDDTFNFHLQVGITYRF